MRRCVQRPATTQWPTPPRWMRQITGRFCVKWRRSPQVALPDETSSPCALRHVSMALGSVPSMGSVARCAMAGSNGRRRSARRTTRTAASPQSWSACCLISASDITHHQFLKRSPWLLLSSGEGARRAPGENARQMSEMMAPAAANISPCRMRSSSVGRRKYVLQM